MNLTISKPKTNPEKRTQIKIMTLILIPVLIISAGLYTFGWINIQRSKNALKQNCMYALKSMTNQTENDIFNIINYIESYSNNSEVTKFLQQDDASPEEGTRIIAQISKTLTEKFPIVDSVFLYNKYSDYCLTSSECTDAESFFTQTCSYSNYDYSFWKKYNYYYSSLYQYRSLQPTITMLYGQSKCIQPLIFRQFGDVNIKNLLIVNVSFDAIMNKSQSEYTSMGESYILNNHSALSFNTATKRSENIYNTPLYNNLIQNKDSFDCTVNRQKYYVVAHSNSNSLNSYTFYLMIPYASFYRQQFGEIVKAAAILLVLLIITIIITLKISSIITAPIKDIASRLSSDQQSGSETDLYRSINSSIEKISKKNSSFDMILPYMQEKYLIDFLNSNDHAPSKEIQDFLMSTLSFEYPYFAIVILQLYPTHSFYEVFTPEEILNIQTGFYSVVKDMFSSEFNSYTLSVEKSALYIIINAPDSENTSLKISEILKKLNELLKIDYAQAALMYGIGNIYKGLDGMKKSHEEALQLLNAMPRERAKINLDVHQPESSRGMLSYKDEESFTNHLITYNYQSAFNLFNDILKRNKFASPDELKNLYTQIVYIIIKVMRSKKLSGSNEEEIDHKTMLRILDKPVNDMKNEILILMSHFKTDYDIQNPTATNITEYIQKEYGNPELSLESISEIFSISKTYICSILKKHLGITFHEYLTQTRISAAKKLLTSTDKSITDIMNETGFSNKQTFSRVFKASTGMTAVKYRKEYHK